MKVPQITYWRTRIDAHAWAVHAIRNWDVPSNGVFMLVTTEDVWKYGWREAIRAKLEERERRLFREFGRLWRHHLCHYFDDEVWCGDLEGV